MNSIQSDRPTIEGITEPAILRYFETLNAGDFDTTASLFADDGALHPPFESPIVGRDAIATYLKAEAQGLQLYPIKGFAESLDERSTKITVKGKVQTPLFGVNVAWEFVLNCAQKIAFVEVKLLASLEELAKIRR